MRVFKATYKDRKGKPRESAKWYVEFSDHRETTRRLPGYTDKGQTEQLGRNVLKLVAVRSNSESPDLALSKWLESIPAKMRETLARWDLLEARAHAASKALNVHLSDFHAALLAKGTVERHAASVRMKCQRIIAGCQFRGRGDMSAAQVERYLAGLRDSEGMSLQTCNHYTQAIRQFCRWMVGERRWTENPLPRLQMHNVAAGRKLQRRALSIDELRCLLTATQSQPQRFGMTGPERALVYWLASETGLRASELRSLSRSSFSFGAKLATVTVEAGSSKRLRRDELPLRPQLAEELRVQVAHMLPAATAFSVPESDDTADMIRADLAAARAAWLEEGPEGDARAQRERSTFLCERDGPGTCSTSTGCGTRS